MQRYFAKEKRENRFLLENSDYHHIKNVMRMGEQDKIEVVYHNILYYAHIENIDKDIQIILDEKIKEEGKKTCFISLIIPILKEQKMDFILQKATELGVAEIIPILMERCIVKIEGKENKKIERWQKIVKEASEQSKRIDMPIIKSITTIDKLNDLEGVKLVCSTQKLRENIKNVMKTLPNCDRINVVVGPEGGLSNREEDILIKKGYLPISLGNRILRVETVPIYLLSILNYENLL